MKRLLLVFVGVVLALTGCNRSGMIDGTKPSAPANAPSKSSAPDRIAHGKSIDLQSYVSAGRTTIFDFTSEYCPPCRAIAPRLHKLHAERADVVVVEVDINRPGVQGIDWSSPVAQQFRLESIPHFKIYGPNGQLAAEGDEAYNQVMRLLQ